MKKPFSNRQQRIQAVVLRRQEGVVVIEDVHDPHNAAAVLRSCEGFGFQRVFFIFEKEKAFNPRRVGKVTSSSANKWLDFKIYRSTKECFRDLKKQGYETIATVCTNQAESLFTAKIAARKVALVLGNEHRGLSEQAISLCDRQIMLPMAGLVQSFNLSVTTAMFLYEITRQRRERGMQKYLLTKSEQRRLLKNFRKR